jgi:carbon-monoxide dehydrogenase small subunit
MTAISLIVNGERVEAEVPARLHLARVLLRRVMKECLAP